MISVAEACLGHKFGRRTADRRHQRPLRIPQQRARRIHRVAQKAGRIRTVLEREVLAYVTVPAANRGPRADLQAHLADREQPDRRRTIQVFAPITSKYQNSDPIVNALNGSILTTDDSKVKVIFVPTYLNKAATASSTRITTNCSSVWTSRSSPPTTNRGAIRRSNRWHSRCRRITTTLAGFGLWVDKQREHLGVEVIRRDDYNDKEVEEKIADSLLRFSALDEKHVSEMRVSAYEISETALWERPLRRLRTSLLRGCRKFGDPYQPRRARREQRPQRTDQFRTPAALRRKAATGTA